MLVKLPTDPLTEYFGLSKDRKGGWQEWAKDDELDWPVFKVVIIGFVF